LVASCVVLTCGVLSAPAAGDEHAGVKALRLELTLDDAVRLALRNNRGLIDEHLERSLQKFALDVAEDRYRPTVSIRSSANDAKDRYRKADLSTTMSIRVPTGGEFMLGWRKPLVGGGVDSGDYSVVFSQPLLKGFGIAVDTAPLRTARISEKINILNFRDAIAGVVTSTIRNWRDLIRGNRQLKIAEASLKRARDQLKINRALIQAGQMAEREALQSEAEIANREISLVEARNALTEANFKLINTLDIDSSSLIHPLETPRARRAAVGVMEGIEVALRNSPNYLQAILNADIARIALEVAKDDLLWDLSLDAEASRAAGAGPTDYTVGLRLMVPLWDRSPRQAWMEARARVQKAERDLLERRQEISIDVRQAMHNLEVGLRRIELARQALALAQQKLEIERSKLRQGLSSAFQLSQFENDLVVAQNTEVNAVVSYENALTSLDQTLGTTLDTWDIRVERVEP